MRIRFALALLFLSSIAPASDRPAVPSVIFDTDLGNDIDDVLALAILHALADRHEVNLLAVTVTKDNPLVVPAIDAINRFYKRPDLPIGMVHGGKTPESSPIMTSLLQPTAGSAAFPHRLKSGSQAPEAVHLLETVLKRQPDQSVTMVQVGFSTNLARLLDSSRALVQRKVKVLVTMAGDFSGASPEFNIARDIPAAEKLFGDWPSPVVTSPFELGDRIHYPAASIEHDFGYVSRHPVVVAYRSFQPMPYDRPTWDLTAVLYAVRPDERYFELSNPGRIHVNATGQTTFEEEAKGTHRYLRLGPQSAVRSIEVFRALASQPPH